MQPPQHHHYHHRSHHHHHRRNNLLGAVIAREERKCLNIEEMQEYCMKLFKYDVIEVKTFESWKARRLYGKQQKKKQIVSFLSLIFLC